METYPIETLNSLDLVVPMKLVAGCTKQEKIRPEGKRVTGLMGVVEFQLKS